MRGNGGASSQCSTGSGPVTGAAVPSRPVRWDKWPQSKAPSWVVPLDGTRDPERVLFLRSLALRDTRAQVVIFVPRAKKKSLRDALQKRRDRHGEAKGLMIAVGPLRGLAVAFRLSDVKAGRTPARREFRIRDVK